jgi:hypothetical protein
MELVFFCLKNGAGAQRFEYIRLYKKLHCLQLKAQIPATHLLLIDYLYSDIIFASTFFNAYSKQFNNSFPTKYGQLSKYKITNDQKTQ